jgi:hypothetical protein
MENRAEGTKQGQGAREREPPPAAHGAAPAEQTAAADCLQRPLQRRSRFRQRLSGGVRGPVSTQYAAEGTHFSVARYAAIT